MPGVTVEAASPALIEKTRTAVTDADGQYRIIDLRPGTYTVTFTLVGFSTVKREGIELTDDFTATVNADLKVGGLEETITVSGQSPLIDTQSVHAAQVADQRDDRRAARRGRSFQNLSVLVPGVIIPLEQPGRRRHRRRALPDAVRARQPRRPDAARHERHAVQQHEQHRRRLQHHAGDQHGHRAGDDGHDQRAVGRMRGRAAC